MLLLLSLIFLFIFIHPMEFEFSNSQITLEIFPEQTYPFLDYPGCPNVYGNIIACLSGVSASNEIELLGDEKTFCYGEREYNPQDLLNDLKKNKIDIYPLHWHKKMNLLQDNEELEIVNVLPDNTRSPIDIAGSIKKNLLLYLQKDVNNKERTRFDFCQYVGLEKRFFGEDICRGVSFVEYMDFVEDESRFVPGDVVAFFKRKTDGHFAIMKMKHYALVIGPSRCISKFDGGGMLYVSDFYSLKKFYQGEKCVKIDPALGKRDDFAANAFGSIVYRPIHMEIVTNGGPVDITTSLTIKTWVWLCGFRHTNGQVLLAADDDIKTSGTCNGVGFKDGKDLNCALAKGTIIGYPLFLHNKALFLVGDEVLHIVEILDSNRVKDIDVPSTIKRNFLRFLTHSVDNYNENCFDLCRRLCLREFREEEQLNEDISYECAIGYVNEENLLPGDAIALCDSHNSLTIIHCAVVLKPGKPGSPGMYLSKFGNGNWLLVTSLQEMRVCYPYDKLILLKPNIMKYKSFFNTNYFKGCRVANCSLCSSRK